MDASFWIGFGIGFAIPVAAVGWFIWRMKVPGLKGYAE